MKTFANAHVKINVYEDKSELAGKINRLVNTASGKRENPTFLYIPTNNISSDPDKFETPKEFIGRIKETHKKSTQLSETFNVSLATIKALDAAGNLPLNRIQDNRIIREVDIQRNDSTTLAWKRSVILSLLSGINIIPNVLLVLDESSGTDKLVVIDGQQRLIAITMFLRDQLSINIGGKMYNYKQLCSEFSGIQTLINSIAIKVNVLNSVLSEKETVSYVFKTLNTKGHPLKAFEVENAEFYSSELIKKVSAAIDNPKAGNFMAPLIYKDSKFNRLEFDRMSEKMMLFYAIACSWHYYEFDKASGLSTLRFYASGGQQGQALSSLFTIASDPKLTKSAINCATNTCRFIYETFGKDIVRNFMLDDNDELIPNGWGPNKYTGHDEYLRKGTVSKSYLYSVFYAMNFIVQDVLHGKSFTTEEKVAARGIIQDVLLSDQFVDLIHSGNTLKQRHRGDLLLKNLLEKMLACPDCFKSTSIKDDAQEIVNYLDSQGIASI